MKRLGAMFAGVGLALAIVGPAYARPEVATLQILGPGALALWTTAPADPQDFEDNVTYTDTMIFLADQVNGPPKWGPSSGAVFAQVEYHTEDGVPIVHWDKWAEAADFTVAFGQPLEWATGSASDVPVITCNYDPDPECLEDGAVSFDLAFTGVGEIARYGAKRPDAYITPGYGVEVFSTGRVDTAIRGTTVEIESEGMTFPGSYVSDPFYRSPLGQHGSRLFWVHNGFVQVCRYGIDPETWSCFIPE